MSFPEFPHCGVMCVEAAGFLQWQPFLQPVCAGILAEGAAGGQDC